MLDALLQKARARRVELGLPAADTTCYRLFHGAADGLEELTVDVYGDWLVASLYTEERGAREEGWLDAVAALGFRGVHLKHRPKQANQLDERERLLRCPPAAVRGETAPESFVVQEGGVPFEVRLGDGLSTGLFLDQRRNRQRVRATATGRSVLNLFAYTCAFGLVAARGGARTTTNMDVAKGVLERGRKNYELAGLAGEGHAFLARDVLESLPRLSRRGERYDLVVLDPPSYASTRGRRFSVERDYPELVSLASALVADGGELLACTNHHRLEERDLLAAVQTGVARAGRRLGQAERVAPAQDFPVTPGRSPELKSVWARL